MKLLSILDDQVELLAEEGRPNLSRLFDSLKLHSIISLEEVSSLQAKYGLETVSQYLDYVYIYILIQLQEPIPQGWLDTAIDRVVEEIGHAFGKHPLDKDGSIIVNGTVELPYDIFKRLRSRERLNCWDIAAALEMTDRPVSVRLGLSIPLHEEDENGKVRPISKPFGRWRNQIDDYRREGKNDQVHLCPLNINANHFTLLEINEQTKTISHYDSMASRKTKTTLIRRVVEVSNLNGKFKDGADLLQEEFKYLGFRYTEVVSLQPT
jgi:hypothetical protein